MLGNAMSKCHPCILDLHEEKIIISAQCQSLERMEIIVKSGCLQVIGVIQIDSLGIASIALTSTRRKLGSTIEDVSWGR